MKHAMIDANVLIYALAEADAKTDAQLRAKYAASARLVAEMDQIRIAAVAWLEVRRNLKKHETDKLADLAPKLRVAQVDVAAAERAVELLHRRNAPETVCKRCFSSREEMACKGCKRMVSKHQRLNDALIVATAITAFEPAVEILFAYDKGVHAFAPFIEGERCIIREPENADGILFDPRHNPVVARAKTDPE